MQRRALLAALYVAVDVSRLFADKTAFASWCEVGDFFYAGYLENRAKLSRPAPELYGAVADALERHFARRCEGVRDGAGKDAFLASRLELCRGMCRGNAECASLCELDAKTYAAFRPAR